MEALACGAVFGERMNGLPISSNKSMIGHTLTAAGAVEAMFTLMTIQNGLMPPTINYLNPDPSIPLDVVANVARPAQDSHRDVEFFRFRRSERLAGVSGRALRDDGLAASPRDTMEMPSPLTSDSRAR